MIPWYAISSLSGSQKPHPNSEVQKAELKWLLDLLQESLGALKSGLQECVALLAPDEPGTTLAISSVRSESVKGFVTRVGTRIEKGVCRMLSSDFHSFSFIIGRYIIFLPLSFYPSLRFALFSSSLKDLTSLCYIYHKVLYGFLLPTSYLLHSKKPT